MPVRSRTTTPSRTSIDLASTAEALARSGSRLEDQFWEARLAELLDKAMAARRTRTVEGALDQLLETRSPGYDPLVELAEARSESVRFTHEDQSWDALLISAPCLAWTRYRLPDGQLRPAQAEELTRLLQTLILAPQAHVKLVPELVRFDRLPQSFQETRRWTQTLAHQSVGRHERLEISDARAPADLLADVFFLIGVVAVPQGEALFQWQLAGAQGSLPAREAATLKWVQGCTQILESSFTGCQVEYLPPSAYYASTRQADQGIRPLTLKSAVTWLQTAAHIPADQLRCAIVACGEQGIEEYRIGFCTRENNDVIYGCVWPALNHEESLPEPPDGAQADTWDTITALLRDAGIQEVRRLSGIQPLEFCEDCGTPYFPNMLGEMQHPELPEEVNPEPVQFH